MTSESEKSRYSGDLIKYHHLIYSCLPQAKQLHREVGKVIRNYFEGSGKEDISVLEIGCGEGEATAEILKQNKWTSVQASDIDPHMIDAFRINPQLTKYFQNGRVAIGQKDAFTYLPTVAPEICDVFTASWTLHNFDQFQQIDLLKQARRVLKEDGLLVLMDKMYDENLDFNRMFREQTRCYRSLLNMCEPEAWAAITDHEKEDTAPRIKINRSALIKSLYDIGFDSVWSTLRIVNDEVLCASKARAK